MRRQIANLIKQGNIAEVNPAECRVRVIHGKLQTDWLPYFVPFAGGVSVHRPPSVGENCIVLSPSGETANGVVLCGLMSSQFTSPSSSPDDTVVEFPDGAMIVYNHISGSLKIDGVKNVNINSPAIKLTGNVTVSGSLTQTGGELSSNGIVLHTHKHPETNGRETEQPK